MNTPHQCHCLNCDTETWLLIPEETRSRFPPNLTQMYLCAICGHKRCPHSDDHRNACTFSNAPGQIGSRYTEQPEQVKPYQRELTGQERDVLMSATYASSKVIHTGFMEQPEQPTSGDYALGYAEGFNDACKPAQPEQVKPWVGLTDEENHIAEVLNKTLGLQYVADKLREKNT